MSRQSFQTWKYSARFILPAALTLLTGCAMGGAMGGMVGGGRGAASARPPYVEDEPKAKSQKPCPPQSQGTQDQATQDCKQADHK
jgi:hypothetical protein